MGLFITAEVSESRCEKGQPCTVCVEICPVNIFEGGGGGLARALLEQEDECTLCNLCVVHCPTQAITIRKLYDE